MGPGPFLVDPKGLITGKTSSTRGPIRFCFITHENIFIYFLVFIIIAVVNNSGTMPMPARVLEAMAKGHPRLTWDHKRIPGMIHLFPAILGSHKNQVQPAALADAKTSADADVAVATAMYRNLGLDDERPVANITF